MVSFRLSATSVLAGLALGACSGSSPDPSHLEANQGGSTGISCTPYDERACPGAPACTTPAKQTCFEDGSGWSACACLRQPAPEPGAAATGAGGAAGSDAGETSGGGEPDPLGMGGQGGSGECDSSERWVPLGPVSLDLFGDITWVADGAELAAGRYRVKYVDGCMKYSSFGHWTIHSFEDGSLAAYLGTEIGEELQLLPGTFGVDKSDGAFNHFEDCVNANLLLDPVEFEFSGGMLGIWLLDSNYSNNEGGQQNRNPTWQLERFEVDDCTN